MQKILPDKAVKLYPYNPPAKPEGFFRTVLHTIRGERLLVDITLPPMGDKLIIRSKYVTATDAEVYAAGYKQAIDLKTGWRYMFQKIYVQFHGLTAYDIENDPRAPNRETSATLYDYSISTASRDFMRGFNKVQLSAMDTKKLTSMAVIAVGAIVGFYILFGGGF